MNDCELPRAATVFDAVAARARLQPEAVLLEDADGALCYGEFLEQCRDLARRLGEAGLRPGQGLGVMGRGGRAFLRAMLAASAAGAVAMPVDDSLERPELEALLEAAPLHAFLCLGEAGGRLEGLARTAGAWTGPAGTPMRRLVTDRPADEAFVPFVPDAAFVRFTSGTTGRSKGVVLSQRSVLERSAAANRGLGLGPGDGVLCAMPMAYHFFVSILLYLRAGCRLILPESDSGAGLLEAARRHRPALLYAAPQHYRRLAAEPASSGSLEGLRLAVSTSVGLGAACAQAFQRRHGIAVSQAYGIIELGLPMINLDAPLERPESVGRVLPDYEAAFLDERGRPVPEGEIGELALRGPGFFAAYLHPPRPLERLLRGGWFLTGDLARREPDGFVTVMGRRKSVINVRGEKVFPEEVEAVLARHPAVARCRVCARRDARGEERVHAEVQPAAGNGAPPPPDALLEYCRRRLSPPKRPATLELVDRIPETPSGKVPRRF